ncbi:MAG: hypothetical protein J07HQW2_00812 [Haloquadratum walsbyi J07HQW2]|uniref:Uncharacterized protein n=1 Tax=Haloquadratum walsbyi J07HQW2 TaxID=1238425 RepID=U1NCI9_9EURY|nr:MAG: hypothetical protein J07HQW2_00812 [Haloquadratum walsbyi J07HQW2]
MYRPLKSTELGVRADSKTLLCQDSITFCIEIQWLRKRTDMY